MPNYQNGKIYSIRSHSRPDLVYVGSTIQPLSVRLGGHKKPSNQSTSKQIIVLGDSYIELIENYSCNSREELDRREGEVIRSMDCVNKRIAGRTQKEYYQDNADTIIERCNQYNKVNADKIKQYYQDNADKVLQQQKQYRQDNADKIKQKLECECGGKYTHQHKARHLKTKKHKLFQTTYDYIYS